MSFYEKLKNNEKVKIAFFGDSVTQGCFEGDADEKDEQFTYRYRFCEMLKEVYPNCEIEMINAGVAGNTSGMGLYRIERDVISKSPDLCVVCFGINDTSFCILNKLIVKTKPAREMLNSMGETMDKTALSLLEQAKPFDAYRYSMDRILTLLLKKGIEIIVLTPNRMSKKKMKDKKNPAYFLSIINARMINKGKMNEMMEIAKVLANKHNIPVADGYARWIALEEQGIVTNDTYVNGTNHPTRELHAELAQVLFSTVKEKLR